MAEKLIEQQWLLYGESSYPSWLLGPALALGVLLSIWWLRGETRKKGIAGAVLPFTWTFMLVLTLWLAWKPALVKILKWENQKKILVYLDRSDSMTVPLLSSDVATRLNHLAHWDPVLAGKRNTGPADLRKALVDLSEETAELLQVLETAEEEFVQGIPQGQSSMESLARIPGWASESRARILDFVSDVSIHKGQHAEFPATGIQELVKAIEFLPGKANPSSAESLQTTSRSIRTLRAAGSNLLPELKTLQASIDRSFVQENASVLKPIFERMSSQSRLDAATSILESMDNKNLTLFENKGPPDRTDIYRVLEQLLSGREDEVISHLFVLSDGGHNGAGRSDISEKIRKSGITLTTVGIGTPEPGVDLAILDWKMPRVIKARRQQQLTVTVKTRGPEGTPFKVVLEQEGKEIASTSAETSGLKQDQVQLSFKSPPAGRHALTLRIDRDDVNTRNNQVHFVLNTVKRTPASLMIGDLPDWDTTFLHLALERAQIESRQIYSGIEKGPPSRGGSPRSIPKSLAQWSRNRLVILQGAPFKGLSPEDINTLYSYVTKEGGSLLILTEEQDSYQKLLATKFGWSEKAPPPPGHPAWFIGEGSASAFSPPGIRRPALGAHHLFIGRLRNGIRGPASEPFNTRKREREAHSLIGFLWQRQGLYLGHQRNLPVAGIPESRACGSPADTTGRRGRGPAVSNRRDKAHSLSRAAGLAQREPAHQSDRGEPGRIVRLPGPGPEAGAGESDRQAGS
ncbi:MAG: hypothetical protein QF473_06875 [Planctomycetota bacterium]|nr:hypothetical protein [Planctomycetota bacterium]